MIRKIITQRELVIEVFGPCKAELFDSIVNGVDKMNAKQLKALGTPEAIAQLQKNNAEKNKGKK